MTVHDRLRLGVCQVSSVWRRTYKPSRDGLVPPQSLAMFKLALIFALPLFFQAALAQNVPPGLGQECTSKTFTVLVCGLILIFSGGSFIGTVGFLSTLFTR